MQATTPADVQPTFSPESSGSSAPPVSDGKGTGAIDGSIALLEKIQRGSAGAVDQFLSESAKTPGKRGPDKKPRKPRGVSASPLGNSQGEAPLAEGSPTPLEPLVVESASFDEETARQLVEIGVGLLNDGAAAIVRAVAKKETGDDKLADEAANAVRMSEKIESAVKTGGVLCAKKYAVRMDYAPELMLGGGLIIWAGQVSMSVKALKAKGAELRSKEKLKEAA